MKKMDLVYIPLGLLIVAIEVLFIALGAVVWFIRTSLMRGYDDADDFFANLSYSCRQAFNRLRGKEDSEEVKQAIEKALAKTDDNFRRVLKEDDPRWVAKGPDRMEMEVSVPLPEPVIPQAPIVGAKAPSAAYVKLMKDIREKREAREKLERERRNAQV